MRRRILALSAFLAVAVTLAPAVHAQILIDVVNDATDPTNRTDSEPSIAVNPLDSNEISIIAFPNAWSATMNAPIFKSRDGGLTWTPILQLPPGVDGSTRSLDQKIAYTADGRLLVAQIPSAVPSTTDCFIYRQAGAADAPLTVGMAYGFDQPHITSDTFAASPFFNRAYSPWANFLGPGLVHSMVAWTIDDGANVNNVGAGDNSSFENRTTRIAVGTDGAVYIVYKTREGTVDANFETAHFRVNRSDDGGVTWTGVGGAAGVSVHGPTAVTTWFTTTFGNPAKGKVARARSSDAWIAVNPSSGDIWVVYCDRDVSTFGQIYAVRSQDHGATWSTPRRVTNGTHHSAYPEVAVTSSGVVGVLYVDYDDSAANISFRHRFAMSRDNGTTWNDTILQAMDPTPFDNAVDGFLWGDYEGLTAAGHKFYGVFAGAGLGRATPQIDPIFFKVGSTATNKDFYVRDWTDTSFSADAGAEPSNHAAFYVNSDVWNRRTNVPPAFNFNDQPIHEPPNNGAGAAGDNFMFARIKRNASGVAQSARARYMYSEFGVGSNYQVAGAAGPDMISFTAADTSVVSPSHAWHLPATVSNHLCLLVEIDTDDDPIQPPSLLGHAPGWPTSDLNVLNDNNKAQRNTVVNHESGEKVSSHEYYAIVHNAGTTVHDFVLDYDVTDGDAQVRGLGGNEQSSGRTGTIKFANLKPGENRWVGVRLNHAAGRAAGVNVSQIERGKPVNGFQIVVEPAGLPVLIHDNLDSRRIFFQRLGATAKSSAATDYAKRIAGLGRSVPAPDEYVSIVAGGAKVLDSVDPKIRAELTSSAFALGDAGDALARAVRSKNAAAVADADIDYLQRADAALTKVQKDRGDAADIRQMMAWQNELLRRGKLKCDRGYGDAMPGDAAAYAKVVDAVASCVGIRVPANLRSMAEIQRAHRDLLLRLE